MDTTYFPNDPVSNRAAHYLSMFGPSQVSDIITAANRHGSSLQRAIFADASSGPANSSATVVMHPLQAFSSEYIKDDYLGDVLAGFSAMVIARFRKPAADDDAYNKVLKDCFGLPEELAHVLAQKIETYDVIGSGKDQPWYESWVANVSEMVRRAVNWIPEVLHIPIANSQEQTYDVDFLYELMNLGKVIKDLNARTSLMSSQALISSNMSMFAAGDVYGDVDEAGDVDLGDITRLSRLRRLPTSIFGNAASIQNMGKQASRHKAKSVADGIGMETQGRNRGRLTRKPGNASMRKSLTRILSGNPTAAYTLAATLGIGAGMLPSILRKFKGKGDVEDGDAYSTVSTMLGDDAAQAWMTGDVDEMAKTFASLAADPHSSGDPEMDNAIAADLGDVENEGDMSPEAGGLFTRMRVNMNRKAAARHQRKNVRRLSKLNTRRQRSESLNRSRHERRMIQPDDQQGFQDEQDVDGNWPSDEMTASEGSDDAAGGADDSEMNQLDIPSM